MSPYALLSMNIVQVLGAAAHHALYPAYGQCCVARVKAFSQTGHVVAAVSSFPWFWGPGKVPRVLQGDVKTKHLAALYAFALVVIAARSL